MANSQEPDQTSPPRDSEAMAKTSKLDDGANRLFDKIEWGLALAITAFLVVCHVAVTINSGGLWRDEVNSVSMVQLPTIGDIWKNLQFDSFPIFWFLVLRFWNAIGLGNDDGYRLLGCLIGLLLLGALWFSARQLKFSKPVFSLLLLAANPGIILWGDSLRGYGLGMALAVFLGCFIWRLTQALTKWNFVMAVVLGLLSVQTLYYNAVLLLAFCCGGFAVAWRHHSWKTVAALCAVGLIAAVSLLPYVSSFKEAATWNELVRMSGQSCTLAWLWEKFSAAIGAKFSFANGSSLKVLVWAWVILFFAAMALGFLCQKLPRFFDAASEHKDSALFAMAALGIGVPAYFYFLKTLRYLTQHWYYFALMLLVALLVDSMLWLLTRSRAGQLIRFGAALLLALTLGQTWNHTRDRFTNIDLMAEYLNKHVEKGDLVVLDWWVYGITFQRYYKGPAAWTTIPPVEFHNFHRYDLIKKQMMRDPQSEVVRPIINSMRETLLAGKKIWVIGGTDLFNVRQRQDLLPAPKSEWEWWEPAYVTSWISNVGPYLQQHTTKKAMLIMPHLPSEHLFERCALMVAMGWKE